MPSAIEPQPEVSDITLNSKELLGTHRMSELFWRQRGLLWKFFSRAIIAGVVVSLLWPKTWQATARLMPPDSSRETGLAALTMLGSKGTDSSLPISGLSDMFGVKSEAALFSAVLKSRTVQDRLIDRFDLRRVYSVKTYERAREILQDRTNVVEDRRSGVLALTVDDRDQYRVRDICLEYVNELNSLLAKVSTSSARRERMFLEQRLKEVSTDLNKSARNFSEFASKNATLDISVQGKAMVEAAATVQGQLIAAQSELQALSATYTESNVRVRTARARIKELQQQLGKLGGTSGEQPDSGDSYPSIRQLPILAVRYSELYRQSKIQEVLYETLTKQYEMAKVQEAKDIPTVRLLDSPVVPEKRSSPKRLQIIFAVSTLGLLIGIGWIWAEASWNQVAIDDPRKILADDIWKVTQNFVKTSMTKALIILRIK